MAGFDHRLRWSRVPTALVIMGDLLVGGRLDRSVPHRAPTRCTPVPSSCFWEHPWRSARTGGLVPFLILLLTIVWRLVEEERILANDLPGYDSYRARVKYRLVPYLW